MSQVFSSITQMLIWMVSHVFSCITRYWNIYFVMYSNALRNAEISYFSCITQCWNIWFPIHYTMLKCLISHALHNAEISDVSCIPMHYAMLKYLISHALHNAEMSEFSYVTLRVPFVWLACITLCWKCQVSHVLRHAEICSY